MAEAITVAIGAHIGHLNSFCLGQLFQYGQRHFLVQKRQQ